jgi:hypothetical protein
VNEDDFPHCPVDPYSITKLTNELLACAWGPGRYSGYTGQCNDFIGKAAIGAQAKLPADFAFRNTKLRWMYVKDMGVHRTCDFGKRVPS